jgi:DnaK suppressor protein
MDPEHARQLLMEALREIEERERTTAREDPGDDELTRLHELSQHPADRGSDLTDRMEHDALQGRFRAERELVELALARLDAGTWGRCVVCHRPIDDDRLEARPDAERCIEHQREFEHRR